jgi:hypothetical protein
MSEDTGTSRGGFLMLIALIAISFGWGMSCFFGSLSGLGAGLLMLATGLIVFTIIEAGGVS